MPSRPSNTPDPQEPIETIPEEATLTPEPSLNLEPDFWDQHKNKIIGAILGILLIGGGGTGYFAWQQTQRAEAAGLYAAARTSMDYESLVARFPRDPSSAAALLRLAEGAIVERDYQAAKGHLENFIETFASHSLAPGAMFQLAHVESQLSGSGKAIELLKALRESHPDSYAAPAAMLREIRLLQAEERTDEANTLVRQFPMRFPGSIYLSEIEEERRFLEAGKPRPFDPDDALVAGPTEPQFNEADFQQMLEGLVIEGESPVVMPEEAGAEEVFDASEEPASEETEE
ncbi:MAG: tol-pal system YbgF family protein [Verrucomicrobiales bacterium]